MEKEKAARENARDMGSSGIVASKNIRPESALFPANCMEVQDSKQAQQLHSKAKANIKGKVQTGNGKRKARKKRGRELEKKYQPGNRFGTQCCVEWRW